MGEELTDSTGGNAPPGRRRLSLASSYPITPEVRSAVRTRSVHNDYWALGVMQHPVAG